MSGRASAAGIVAGFVLTGCMGTPTPLAPSVGGSVGVPHQGVLTDGVELPLRGPGFVRYRRHGKNHWGNARLVATIERAAQAVADALPGGAPLEVGDLSAKRGGAIQGHHSHRNGRDVDLLLYVATPSGASIRSRGFVALDGDGIGRVHPGDEYVRLDVERQWLLVRTLLESPEASVQWIFCSRGIEALLIDYARARGEDDALVWHAETVLLQPGDSTPHDDHIHVRIACTPGEAVVGCEGGGPYWEWLPPLPELPLDDALLADAAVDDPFDLGPLDPKSALAGDAE